MRLIPRMSAAPPLPLARSLELRGELAYLIEEQGAAIG